MRVGRTLWFIGQLGLVVGGREFPGYRIWDVVKDADGLKGLPDACKTSLTQAVKCDPYTLLFLAEAYRGSLDNDTLTESVCDPGCGLSLKSWFDNVATTCEGSNVTGSAATKYGGQIWSGYNETCLTDPESGEYCNDVIAGFTDVEYTSDRPKDELCSFCYVQRLEMMQQSPYSVYDEYFQRDLETVYAVCGHSGKTEAPRSLDSPPELPPDPICISEKTHITSAGDTCDSIALKYSISSAALVMSNSRYYISCDHLNPGMELCLPESCSSVYTVQNSDTCWSIERANSYYPGRIRKYNAWVSWDCSNLQSTIHSFGRVVCTGPQGGIFTATAPIPGVTLSPGYSRTAVDPPSNATVADGTTLECARWRVPKEGESCAMICLQEGLTSTLFLRVNPSLEGNDCSASLRKGVAYCVSPTRYRYGDDDLDW
ncbi:hypothetical protein BJX63DRAFT_394482 [Aspergillus granulosus]|uniref:LysM domain-containing protein n=1 Tax=Aspergillus granulosus TaxID=176169 RepID=A0ABR4HCT4_9EURO